MKENQKDLDCLMCLFRSSKQFTHTELNVEEAEKPECQAFLEKLEKYFFSAHNGYLNLKELLSDTILTLSFLDNEATDLVPFNSALEEK